MNFEITLVLKAVIFPIGVMFLDILSCIHFFTDSTLSATFYLFNIRVVIVDSQCITSIDPVKFVLLAEITLCFTNKT